MPAAAAVVVAIAAAYSAKESHDARKEAKDQAAAERERLAALDAKEAANPVKLPTTTDTQVARRVSIATIAARRGRASTILTSPSGVTTPTATATGTDTLGSG